MNRIALAALAALLLTSCGDNPQGFEPWPDGAQFWVGSPLPDTAASFSPGGDKALFTSAYSGTPCIYFFTPGGGDPIQLTYSSLDESCGPTGAWCDTLFSDVGMIVYSATREDSTTEIRWIPGNSYSVHLVLYDSLPHRTPTWTPQTDSILYCTQLDGHWGMWKIAVDSGVPVDFHTPLADCLRPSYSPDGEWILYQYMQADDWDIWAMRPDGSDAHFVVAGSSQDIHPTWSPYEGWFAFASDRTGNYEIYAASMDQDTLIQLTDDESADLYPAWNPTYGYIVFSSERVNGPGTGDFDLYWIDEPPLP